MRWRTCAHGDGSLCLCLCLVALVTLHFFGTGCTRPPSSTTLDDGGGVPLDGGRSEGPVHDSSRPPCKAVCPAPASGAICVSGRAFEWTSFIKTGGDPAKATLVTHDDYASLRLIDLIDFISVDSISPISTASLDEDGCFHFEGVAPPFTGGYMVVADDKVSSPSRFALLGNFVAAASSANTTGVEALVLLEKTAEAWGKDLLSKGAAILWFRAASGEGLAGVEISSCGQVSYFGDDPSQAPTSAPAGKTTRSGAVLLGSTPLGGTCKTSKSGCTFAFPSARVATYKGRISFAEVRTTCSN
jgi:hypothetical protein